MSDQVEEEVPMQFSIDVEAGKPQKIDFSKAPKSINPELLTAEIILVNRNDTGDKGPLTLKVKYSDVQSYEGDIDKQPIVQKEDVIQTFQEGDYEQKDIHFRFTEEHNPEFFVEGNGSCNIYGCFHQDDDFEEEEEEEEANDDNKEE